MLEVLCMLWKKLSLIKVFTSLINLELINKTAWMVVKQQTCRLVQFFFSHVTKQTGILFELECSRDWISSSAADKTDLK